MRGLGEERCGTATTLPRGGWFMLLLFDPIFGVTDCFLSPLLRNSVCWVTDCAWSPVPHDISLTDRLTDCFSPPCLVTFSLLCDPPLTDCLLPPLQEVVIEELFAESGAGDKGGAPPPPAPPPPPPPQQHSEK